MILCAFMCKTFIYEPHSVINYSFVNQRGVRARYAYAYDAAVSALAYKQLKCVIGRRGARVLR